MARIRAEIKRAQLRSLWRNASGNTLLDVLNAFQEQSLVVIANGRKVSSTSGNNYQVSFVPQLLQSEIAEEEFVALSEEYFDNYSIASAALITGGNPTPSDQQIFDQMIDQLATVREQMLDTTTLRYPTYGPHS